MKYYLKFILVLLTCWSMASVAISQETLEEKRVRADELFKNKNWSSAEPLYASIISNSPKNHDLNFRYGTSLLYGSKNKEEAIKRLRFSVTGQGIDRRAYYYLGQAYHLNYQFNDAIKQYSKFKELASPSDLKDFDVETDLKACTFGKKLLANITDMVVLQKTELKTDNFYDLYKLDDIGGTLLITDVFQSKLDKKKNHRPVIHFPVNSPYIYYSSYGKDGSTGLDIYVKKKLPGGEWSLEQKVRGQVNTDRDEDFAYMHPNGQYLYFCSKGHNSMGGFDVFRSRYNESNQSFGLPENLDFAISSPDDDLLFVVDSLDRVAYFSSTRESGQGKITVYKVRVDRIPMQMAVIKGNFLNTVQASEKEVEIEIEDFSSGRIIGKFNSKKTNGDYLITFPKSGKYRYIITPVDSDISHVYVVDIPPSKEFRPLKQSMTLKLDGSGEEFIEVTDRFSENFEDPTAVMAEVYRQLSKLPPNAASFDLDSLDALKETDAVLVDAGLDVYITDEGLQAVLKDRVEDVDAAKSEEEKQASIAYNVAQEKSDLANEKMIALNKLLDDAENANGAEKTKILETVIGFKKEIADLNNESQSLIVLAESIDKSVDEKTSLLNNAKDIQNKANNLPDGDRAALLNLVQNNAPFFEENIKDNPTLENTVTNALTDGAKEQKRVQNLSVEISTLSKNKRGLESENTKLQKQLAAEKKKKVIEEIQRKIDNNASEIDVLDGSIKVKSRALDEALTENESVRNGVAAAIVLKDDYANAEYEKPLSDTQKQAISAKVKTNDLQENLTLVDQVLEKNNVSSFNIDLYANDEKTSSYSLEDWNDAIDAEKEKLQAEKLKASLQRQKEIQAEMERLEKLREEKAGSYEIAKNDPTDIVATVKQGELLTNYDQRKEGINQIVSEADRKKATLDLNYELLEEIEKEQKRLEQILADNPKAKNIKNRLANLQTIEADINNEVSADQTWLADNEAENAFNPDNVLTNLDPDYERKINEAYEIIEDTERNDAVRGLNEIVLEKANERMQELQAIIASDSDNKKAKDELVYLEDFIRDVSANKEQPLIEPNQVNIAELSAEVGVNDLIRNYDSRKKVIDGITDEYQRRTAENILYLELVDKARSELAKMDQLAEKNPDNKTISKRQDALKDLDKDYNKLIVKNKDWLDKNKPEQIVYADANTVRMVKADYQLEVDRIDKLDNEKEQSKAIESLNEQTLEKIGERVDVLETELSENPSNVAASKEKQDLVALREMIDDKKDQALLSPSSNQTIVTNPGTNDVFTTYDMQLGAINESDKSDAEKEADKIELNEELIDLVDAELKVIDAQIDQNPEQADQLIERKTSLETLKSTASDGISKSEDIIDGVGVDVATDTETHPVVSETSLMPDYENDLEAIATSGKPERERLNEENELNKMLIAAIDYKLADLAGKMDENPDDKTEMTADINTLNEIKAAKQNNISTNELKIDAIDPTTDVATRPLITVGALMSDYDSQLADIRNGAGTDPEKLEKENELNETLIELVDKRIADLETEKANNLDQVELIEKDIDKLRNIKRSTQNAININKDQLSQLTANKLERPTITIGTLLPEFDEQIAAVDQGEGTETEKLIQKNEINNALIRSIDNKISEIQEEWEEDPTNGFTYNEEINKLEELKESKRNEVDRNIAYVKELEGDIAEVGDVKTTDFDSEEAKAAVTEFNRELDEINELNADIEALTTELNASSDPKDRSKIQKSIDKANQNKASLENKVIEGLEEAIAIEIVKTKDDLQTDKELTATASQTQKNGLSEDVRTANENLIIADLKLAEANTLRDEADKEKDVLVANDKLKRAFQLEEEAKTLINESNRIFKMARAGNNYANEEEIITAVPENVADRKSTQLLDEAGDLRTQANVYYDRAKVLRDSSETVKKKHIAAVLAESDDVELKGDQLNAAANNLEDEAETIKVQEEKVLAAQIANVSKEVDSETTENVATSEPYKAYFAEKNEGDEKIAQANAIDTEIGELKNKRTRRFKMAVSGSADNPGDVIDQDEEIAETQAKIDSLTEERKRLRDEALANYTNAKNILNNQNAYQEEDMIALEQKNIKPFERKVPINADFEIPDLLEVDIFRTTENAVYSDEAPIPVSQKQPSGLVYKVQVGAFRNALPQDHFKEFAPISGEVLSNGITRYMVGYFTKFVPANEAKGKVNGIGYSDAFVVAYCNGDRITIDRARLIEQGLIACDGTLAQDENENLTSNNTTTNNTTTNNTTADNTTTDNTTTNNTTADNTTIDNTTTNNTTTDNTTTDNTTTNNTTADNTTTDNTTTNNTTTDNTASTESIEDQSTVLTIEPETAEERLLVNYYTSVPDAADANQIEIIKGLFYTVQIGVYSKPVPNGALFNIQPLNSQRTSGGYIRYSTGIYTSEKAATIRKEEVVGVGVADAFVTAYFDGERITVEEALLLLVREGADVLVGKSKPENDSSAETPIKESFNKEGLHYRILIGKYEDAIPGEYATLLLRGDDIFETEVDQVGRTCLISKKIDTYDEMVDRLTEFADLGIEEMDIVTYYKYDVIPFDEGEKIRNDEEIEELHPFDDMEGVSANDFVYSKEAVYFKIKLGEFEDNVPADFTNLLLLHEEEENIDKEETIHDETVFMTRSYNAYSEAQAAQNRLKEKGFDRAIILAYHKYDEISINKAREILGE